MPEKIKEILAKEKKSSMLNLWICKKFWFFCLNNPRFSKGQNDLPDEKKCYVFHENENFKLIKTIRLPDYLLYLVKKN